MRLAKRIGFTGAKEERFQLKVKRAVRHVRLSLAFSFFSLLSPQSVAPAARKKGGGVNEKGNAHTKKPKKKTKWNEAEKIDLELGKLLRE